MRYTVLSVVLFLVFSFTAHAVFDWSDHDTALPEDESKEDGIVEEPLGVVRMEGTFLNGDIVQVKVYAEEMRIPVLGTAFYLQFPQEHLSFLRYDPGDFLERAGDPFYLVQYDPKHKAVVFGSTLRRDDSFPMGEGLLATMYFQILDEGEHAFSFSRGVVSTIDTVRQDITPIEWQDSIISRQTSLLNTMHLPEGATSVLGSLISQLKSSWAVPGFSLCMLALGIFFFMRSKKRHPARLMRSS